MSLLRPDGPPSEKGRRALGGFMVVAGVMHFVMPKPYEQLIPEPLGSPRAWVYGSGVAELAAGALTLNPRTARLGAWASLAVIVGVYPGNLKMALDAGRPTDAASTAAWLRLPLQFPMMAWAYRHTRKPAVGSTD